MFRLLLNKARNFHPTTSVMGNFLCVVLCFLFCFCCCFFSFISQPLSIFYLFSPASKKQEEEEYYMCYYKGICYSNIGATKSDVQQLGQSILNDTNPLPLSHTQSVLEKLTTEMKTQKSIRIQKQTGMT